MTEIVETRQTSPEIKAVLMRNRIASSKMFLANSVNIARDHEYDIQIGIAEAETWLARNPNQ